MQNPIINTLRTELHTKTFEYKPSDYPFKEALEKIFGVELKDIHRYLGQFDRFERKNDQLTLAHKVFYSSYREKIMPIYVSFIKHFIADIVRSKFYYQLIPTFRIGLPGNTFVGEYHKDSKYHHQAYEINFNLGLANYMGKAALRVQEKPDVDNYILLECPYGKVFSFDHIDCVHGSDPNESNDSMVSFDFRLALKDLYFETNARSINLRTKFTPGSYFSNEVINQ